MNIDKWRVVNHQDLLGDTPYPWHVYPPGVPVATTVDDLVIQYLNGRFRVAVRRTHAEALALANSRHLAIKENR